MKKIFALITAVTMLCLPITCAFAEAVPSAVKKSAHSAVRLTLNTNFGTENITAVAVGKGFKTKYLMTGLRAVEGYNGDILAGSDDDENVKASVIISDKTRNIAVLELQEELEGVKPAKIDVKDKKNGTEVYALGYCAVNDADKIFEGSIQSLNLFSSEEISAEIYQVTVGVNSDNNGGMLVNKSGNLLGICYYDGNTDINKAITGKMIAETLDSNDIGYRNATLLYVVLILAVIAAAAAAGVFKLKEFLTKKRENAPVLIGRRGDFASQRIPLTSENISIGRDAKCCQVVILNDPKVSRCHCSIHYDKIKNMFVLTDLSSTHGTYINGGQKLEPNVPVYLNSGSVFSVGGEATEFSVSEGGVN